MTKNELYKDILQKLIEYLKNKNYITEIQDSELQDDLDYENYEEVCVKLLSYSNINNFTNTIKYIKNGLDDTDDLTVTLPLRHVGVKEINKSRYTNFFYSSTNLIVITSLTISELIRQSLEEVNGAYAILEKLWLTYKDNAAELNYLWEIYEGQHSNEYYLFTNEADDETTNWRLYSYAYFCFVNENKFKKPAILNFHADTKFITSIPYNQTNKYEQYFDAYNVMSESKFADDVLLRYLRMYQILEYFAYRRVLADMTKGNVRENGFVRNIVNKVSGRSSNEFNELKSNLKVLFPSLTGVGGHSGIFAATDITNDMKSFIKDKLLLSNFGFTDDSMWQVIYKLRNCIVHNKESELHFTYSNTNIYEPGINLMKVIIQKMEPQIVKLINDPNITGLEFEKQEVQVY